jgi:hypothetical protein
LTIGAWRSGLARQLGVLEVARSNRVAPTYPDTEDFGAGMNFQYETLTTKQTQNSEFKWYKQPVLNPSLL